MVIQQKYKKLLRINFMQKLIFTFIFILSVAICFAQEDKEYTSLEEALANPNEVYKLDLSDQDLTAFPKEILQFKNLEKLYLMNNQLTELPAEISELQNLESLLLVDNQFTEFPKEVCSLKNLEYLYLPDNQLQNLPAEISELQKLRILVLNDNQLKILPPELGSLQSLEDLRLNRNQLSTFPLAITELPNLESLDLDNNQLEALPAAIGQLQKLRSFSIEDNQLTSLPIEICNIQSLKYLYLDDNQLGELPTEIGQLQNLNTLRFTNNQLSSLPSSIVELQNLEDLYVDGNNISETDLETLKEILSNCKVIFWQNGLELLEKKEWVQVITDTEKNRDVKFSVQFEKDMLRLQTDLLSKGKYKQNLYKDELLVEQNPHSDYDGGLFTLIKNEEESDSEYHVFSEDKIYITLSFVSKDNDLDAYFPYYSKSKYETLNQLPTKKKIKEEEFLQFLDEIMFVLNADWDNAELIYQGFVYDELNFASSTDLVHRVFEKQGYNPFTSVKAYNKAYDKYENQEAAKEKIASIQGFFEDDDDEN